MHSTTNMQIWPMVVVGGDASTRAGESTPIPIIVSDSSGGSDDGLFGASVLADGVRPQ